MRRVAVGKLTIRDLSECTGWKCVAGCCHQPDEINTNIAFTVRELTDQVPIITTANSPYPWIFYGWLKYCLAVP